MVPDNTTTLMVTDSIDMIVVRNTNGQGHRRNPESPVPLN